MREERVHGKGVGVYVTLLQSDTVQSYGRVISGTSPVGVDLSKKPKDLKQVRVKILDMGRCGCVYYSAAVRYSTSIWSHKRRHESCLVVTSGLTSA